MVASVAEGDDKPRQVPADVPHLRARGRQQDRPARARRLRSWTASTTTSTRCIPGVDAHAHERADGRGRRRAARLARAAAGPGGGARLMRAGRRRSTSASPAASGSSRAEARAARAAVPRGWRSASRAAGGSSRSACSPADAQRRAPRRRRVRPSGHRRQARAARARRGRVRTLRCSSGPTTSRWRSARARRSRRRSARRATRGCLTIAFAAVGAEWELRRADRRPVHRAGAGRDRLPRAVGARARLLRAPRAARRPRRGPASRHRRVARSSIRSSAESEHDLDAVLADVAGSVLAKAGEAAALRAATLGEGREVLEAAARSLRGVLRRAAAKLLALGNGGSATDAMDAVADLRRPPPPLAAAAGDRPRRGPVDPHRGRQRRRRRGDVRAAGDRVRAARRRAAGVLHQRRLGERARRARAGAPATGS